MRRAVLRGEDDAARQLVDDETATVARVRNLNDGIFERQFRHIGRYELVALQAGGRGMARGYQRHTIRAKAVDAVGRDLKRRMGDVFFRLPRAEGEFFHHASADVFVQIVVLGFAGDTDCEAVRSHRDLGTVAFVRHIELNGLQFGLLHGEAEASAFGHELFERFFRRLGIVELRVNRRKALVIESKKRVQTRPILRRLQTTINDLHDIFSVRLRPQRGDLVGYA